jgi:hypothetical protein
MCVGGDYDRHTSNRRGKGVKKTPAHLNDERAFF